MKNSKSLFQIKKSSDKTYPWVTTANGSPVTRHTTKTEALKKIMAARKKEKAFLKRVIR